ALAARRTARLGRRLPGHRHDAPAGPALNADRRRRLAAPQNRPGGSLHRALAGADVPELALALGVGKCGPGCVPGVEPAAGAIVELGRLRYEVENVGPEPPPTRSREADALPSWSHALPS